MEVQSRLDSPHRQILDFLTTLGRRAAHRFHQFPGPVTIPTEDRQTTVEEDTETREPYRL